MKKAVVLAAGQGSRLEGVTRGPKPLVKVDGVPLLYRVLNVLERAGIDEVLVVTGHLRESIEKAVEEYPGDIRVTTAYNPDWEKGNGTSALAAAGFVTGPTILTMSDHLYPPEIVERLLATPIPVEASLLAVDRDIQAVFDLGDATKVQLKGDRIAAIGKDLKAYDALDVGVFLVTPSLMHALADAARESKDRLSLSDGVHRLAAQGRMRGLDVTGVRWMDVDDARALKHANLLFSTYGETMAPRERTEDPILMNPGPVCTSPRVRSAMGSRRICHRDSEFSLLFNEAQAKLREVFRATPDHDILIVTSSGTGAVEAMVATFVPAGRSLLVLSNGAFGERIAEIAVAHGISLVHERLDWGQALERISIEAVLDRHPEVGAVAVVHHETSVAAINPLAALGRAVRRRGLLFLVDAVASLGAEDLDVERDAIDVCASSSNKSLHAPSGLAPLCVGPRAWDAIAQGPGRGYYFDLRKYRKYANDRSQTPFTPAVQNLLALNAAVEDLLEEGVDGRRERYLKRQQVIERRLADLGIEPWRCECRRAAGLSIHEVPAYIAYDVLYREMKERGFIIYECKERLSGRFFQIATMGEMTIRDVERFCDAMEEVAAIYRPRMVSAAPSDLSAAR